MNLGKRKGYKVFGQKVVIEFEQGRAELWAVTPKIINVFCGLESGTHDSKAIEGEKQQPVELSVEEKQDGLWIGTGAVSVRVSDGFFVDFYDIQGREVCMDYRGERRPLQVLSDEAIAILAGEGHKADRRLEHAFDVVKQLRGDEHFYGLGDKTGFLDKRNYEYEMWNSDIPDPQVDSFKALYKSIPFFMTLTGEHVYGIFLDNTYKSFFDMGKESQAYYYFGAAAGNLDYYYLAGATLAEVLSHYSYLTGTCPLPHLDWW